MAYIPLVERVIPVSYTHLDVYKRQGLVRATTVFSSFPSGFCYYWCLVPGDPLVVHGYYRLFPWCLAFLSAAGHTVLVLLSSFDRLSPGCIWNISAGWHNFHIYTWNISNPLSYWNYLHVYFHARYDYFYGYYIQNYYYYYYSVVGVAYLLLCLEYFATRLKFLSLIHI